MSWHHNTRCLLRPRKAARSRIIVASSRIRGSCSAALNPPLCEPAAALSLSGYIGAAESRKVRLALSSGDPGRIMRVVPILLVATVPFACTLSEPASQVETPFIGTWVTAEDASITIRPDTIVQHQPDGQSAILDKSACGGVFRFVYGTKTRQALTDLVPRQPELRRKLSDLLVDPSYSVAELDCDRGDQTYILLNDRQLIAIYRDGDIGAIDHLSRR